jgi:hypothetical protein
MQRTQFATDALLSLIAGRVVKINPLAGPSSAPIILEVDDPDTVAQRCWDAGFTVRVQQDETGRAPLSVIDPLGRRVDLVPQAALSIAQARASRERR